ncbi:MAG: tetratricopeptide repeat protein [Parvularculaceae bacterium]|nr:tetratricopeptide repeat protein [Parvularculaceae bacterium]
MKKALPLFAIVAAFAVAPAYAAGSGGAAGLPSSSGPRVDPAKAYQDGVAALQAKDYKAAEKNFGDVLSVAPKNAEANYYMALAKSGLDKPKQAVRYLERSIKERPNFVEAREKLALVSIDLGDPDKARAQLAAIEGLKAECSADGACDDPFKARVDKAIDRLREALRPKVGETPESMVSGPEESATSVEPPVPEGGPESGGGRQSLFFTPKADGAGLYVAAVRLINEARYQEAIASLNDAQVSVGPHPDILNYLGFANRKLGRIDDAKSWYAQALAINPRHLGANEYLGELYLEIGDLASAQRQLATLDRLCAFGCAEREDLARLIALKSSDRWAAK